MPITDIRLSTLYGNAAENHDIHIILRGEEDE
jgi:hypothetical protein